MVRTRFIQRGADESIAAIIAEVTLMVLNYGSPLDRVLLELVRRNPMILYRLPLMFFPLKSFL